MDWNQLIGTIVSVAMLITGVWFYFHKYSREARKTRMYNKLQFYIDTQPGRIKEILELELCLSDKHMLEIYQDVVNPVFDIKLEMEESDLFTVSEMIVINDRIDAVNKKTADIIRKYQ